MENTKIIIKRFLKAFLAGSFSAMSVIAIPQISNTNDLKTFLGSLAIAGLVGGITGVIMAVEKYLSLK